MPPETPFDPQVYGCRGCDDGRHFCVSGHEYCEATARGQARQSQDQTPFKAPGGIPVYDAHSPKVKVAPDSGRRYGPMGLYLSPGEEEALSLADPQSFAELGMMAAPVLPQGPRLEAAVRAAAIENALASEAMGIPTEDVVAALGQSDMVNLPEHYARFKIEPIRFIVENGLNWFQGNIVKYGSRGPHKHDTPFEDIEKIVRYSEMWADYEKGDPDWWLPRGHARRAKP